MWNSVRKREPWSPQFEYYRALIHLHFIFIFSNVLVAPVFAQLATPARIPGFDAALQAAEQRSGALPSRDAVASSARELAIAARQLPDPTLRMSLDNVVIDGSESWHIDNEPMTMQSVGLMQTFTRRSKRAARAEHLEQEALLAESYRLLELTELRKETASDWFDLYYAQHALELLREQREESAILVGSSEATYRAGLGSQADIFMARSELALLDDRIREAETKLANARTALERWTGPLASVPAGPSPDISILDLESNAIEHALSHHPALQVAAREEALALADAELARQDRHEDWTVEFMLSRRAPDFGNMVSIGVSIPLQLGRANKQDRQLAAKLALIDSVRGEVSEMQREHLAETQRLLDTWRSNRARLAQWDADIGPLAQQRTQAASSAYRGNTGALAGVLEARRAEIDTRLARLRLEHETASLWVQLEFLIADNGAAAATQEDN